MNDYFDTHQDLRDRYREEALEELRRERNQREHPDPRDPDHIDEDEPS